MSRRSNLLCVIPHRWHRSREPDSVPKPVDDLAVNGNSDKSNSNSDQKPALPSEIHPALRRRGAQTHASETQHRYTQSGRSWRHMAPFSNQSTNDSCVTFPLSVPSRKATKESKEELPKLQLTDRFSIKLTEHAPCRERPRVDGRPRPQPAVRLPGPYQAPSEQIVRPRTRRPKITCHPAEVCPHLNERLTHEAADTACSLGLGTEWHCMCSNNQLDWEACPLRPKIVFLKGMRYMTRDDRKHIRKWLNDVANEGAPGLGLVRRRRHSEP